MLEGITTPRRPRRSHRRLFRVEFFRAVPEKRAGQMLLQVIDSAIVQSFGEAQTHSAECGDSTRFRLPARESGRQKGHGGFG